MQEKKIASAPTSCVPNPHILPQSRSSPITPRRSSSRSMARPRPRWRSRRPRRPRRRRRSGPRTRNPHRRRPFRPTKPRKPYVKAPGRTRAEARRRVPRVPRAPRAPERRRPRTRRRRMGTRASPDTPAVAVEALLPVLHRRRRVRVAHRADLRVRRVQRHVREVRRARGGGVSARRVGSHRVRIGLARVRVRANRAHSAHSVHRPGHGAVGRDVVIVHGRGCGRDGRRDGRDGVGGRVGGGGGGGGRRGSSIGSVSRSGISVSGLRSTARSRGRGRGGCGCRGGRAADPAAAHAVAPAERFVSSRAQRARGGVPDDTAVALSVALSVPRGIARGVRRERVGAHRRALVAGGVAGVVAVGRDGGLRGNDRGGPDAKHSVDEILKVRNGENLFENQRRRDEAKGGRDESAP